MTRREPYTECKLYYDGFGRVEIGHYLRTPAGSAYWITGLRQSRTLARRVHLKCLRWPVGEIPEDGVVHPLHWYARAKRKAVRQ